jgi:hypothetical protein
MGTRGAYGFRIDRKDKLTYNHFDSYPEILGRKMLEYIVATPLDMMREVASSIIMVDEHSKPDPELIKKYRKYSDLSVSEHRYDSWYCLLRNSQGDLFPYNNNLRHMIDYNNFPYDSLFCEWAYIINIDTKLFEIYRGFNKNPSAPGRYAKRKIRDNNNYRGVALITEIPLPEITAEAIDGLVKKLDELGKKPQIAA